MKLKLMVVVIAGFGTLIGPNMAQADLLNFGSTYTISGTDFAAGDFTNVLLTLSSSPQTIEPGLQITETTTLLGGGAEFAEFYISTVSAVATPPPLVSNGGGNFSITVNNIQLTAATVSSNYYFDYATNGAANTGIAAFSGAGVEINPNSGSLGAGLDAFYFLGFVPGPASTTTSYDYFCSPFSACVSFSNVDPNANGYFFGVELTPSATPLPAALPLFATGLGAMGLLGWRRKRKAAALAA